MNPDYQNKALPKVQGMSSEEMFPNKPDPMAVDIVSKLLKYDPNERIKPYQALMHPFFDELRDKELSLPNGNCIPDLFSFSPKELHDMGGNSRDALIPSWYDPMSSPGFHIIRTDN